LACFILCLKYLRRFFKLIIIKYMQEKIILVDENDREIGLEEKLAAHRNGKLHRAFSIFIFNTKGELMLQKRAVKKYHSGGLWSNTCCSHPRAGEETAAAAHRRLQEEMGFDCGLEHAGSFIYNAELDNGLIEHEFDHLYIGFHDGMPNLNLKEAQGWKWIKPAALRKDIASHPENYTYWLKEALKKPGKFPGG